MDIRLCLVVLHLLVAASAEDQFLQAEIALATNDTAQTTPTPPSPPADSQPQNSTASAPTAQNATEASPAQNITESTPSPQSPPQPAMAPPQPCVSCESCCVEGKCEDLKKCEELGLSPPTIFGLPRWLVFLIAGALAILGISLVVKYCFSKKQNPADCSLKEKLVKEKIPQTEINVPF